MKENQTLAFDRASVRTMDEDGRMKVAVTNISKANVCPYFGREIPGAEGLGLDADRLYKLLRDPAELQAAAATFNSIPLLNKHVPFDAESYDPEDVVGATGTDAVFDAPYLKNSLVVWDADAIRAIESNEQRELSCAYRYDPDMTPGEYEGESYDGVMRNIRGNHVALVAAGRAGPDVVVGDSEIQPTKELTMKASRKAIAVKAAIGEYLRTRLAKDAAIGDIGALVRGVKAATIAEGKVRIAQAVQKAVKGKLAQDANLDMQELIDLIMSAAKSEPDDEAEDEDDASKEDDDKKGDKAEDEDDEPKKPDDKDKAEDEDDDDENDDEPEAQAAMDAAIKSAVKAAERATIARMNAIREAEKDVFPLVGEVVAQDSAAAVYKLALDQAGIDTKGVHPSAYQALVRMLAKTKTEAPRASVAMDASANDSFAERYPTAGKLIRS